MFYMYAKNKMRRVLLINPCLGLNQRYGFLSGAGGVEIPLGLCSLAAYIRQQGFEVDILDAQAFHYDDETIIKKIISGKFKYIGLTAATLQIHTAVLLARTIKACDSSLTIFIGGTHVSAMPYGTLEENRCFDIGVIGEGEETFCESLFALERKDDLTKVKGLSIRINGKVVFTGQRPRIKNLDSLPVPAFDLLPRLDKYYYLPIQNGLQFPAVSLATSRGCLGKCVFCDRSVYGNSLSFYSAGYIADLLQVLRKKYNIRSVMFQDDDFFSFKKRLEDFCAILKEKRLDMSWSASVRVDTVDPGKLKLAKQSGCWQLSYGIESADQHILDSLRKNISRAVIEQALRWTRQAGILAKAFLIFGNPGETPQSIDETIAFVKSQPLRDVSITFFTPYPGTEIWQTIDSYGTLERNFDKMTCFDVVFVPKGLSKQFLIDKHKEAIRGFYFRFAVIFSYCTRMRSFSCLRRFVKSAWGIFCYVLQTKKESRLIVSADDFGLTHEFNAAVSEACLRGSVSSISLMANGYAFDEAVDFIKKNNETLDVGVHFCLVGEKSLLSHETIPTLVDTKGYFYADYIAFLKAYCRGKINITEVEKELEAQLLRILRQGIAVSHIDSHQHLHMLPKILKVVIGLAKKYNIGCIRFPYLPAAFGARQFKNNPRKFFGFLFLNGLCFFQRKKLARERIKHIDYYCNVSNMGDDFEKVLKKIIRMEKQGCGEISFHPAITTRMFQERYSDSGYGWDKEYRYLISGTFDTALAESRMTKINCKEFLKK